MPRKPNARVLAFDIEATNLQADFGRVLCVSWMDVATRRVETVSVLDFPARHKRDATDDKLVVKTAAEVLSSADVVVSWYGKRFDWPFLQSRLLVLGLPPMPPVPHVDLWRTAKYKMRLHSNRLASVQAFLGLADAKTTLEGPMWIRAAAGHKASLRYVIAHCEADVRVLGQAYERMKPLISDHPNLAILEGRGACPICGVLETLVKRGSNITRTTKTQRYQCKSCGGWSSGKSQRLGIDIR